MKCFCHRNNSLKILFYASIVIYFKAENILGNNVISQGLYFPLGEARNGLVQTRIVDLDAFSTALYIFLYVEKYEWIG